MTHESLLTTKQLAAYLQVSTRTVRKYVQIGLIQPHIQFGEKGEYRFLLSLVVRALQQCHSSKLASDWFNLEGFPSTERLEDLRSEKTLK